MKNLSNMQKVSGLFAVLSLVLITAGVTYAIFTYTRSGTTENSIKSGSITFWYDEVNRQGNSISIIDALPMSDTDGKNQSNAFNFRIVSNTSSTIAIPYTITLRQKSGTDNIGDKVKVYLAKTTGYDAAVNTEVEAITSLFSSLEDVEKNGYQEKILYQDEAPVNSTNYNQNYRLKMWLDESIDFTDGTYSDKTFTITVNVYAESLSQVASNLQGLAKMVYDDNILITTAPTLTNSSNNTSDVSGLYALDVTNGFGGADGTTYYFRGNVNNNYVSFAGKTWRIVRINEDGTVRIILDEGISGASTYQFNNSYIDYSYMYYSNSGNYIKKTLEDWYSESITGTSATKVATGNYFCEAAKAKRDESYTSGSADMIAYNSYTPDLVCNMDGNNKGLLNLNVGLINYDEVVFAGGYFNQANNIYYLYKNFNWWTMSPAGFTNNIAYVWRVIDYGSIRLSSVYTDHSVRPVINLKADVTATGTGTSFDPYVIQ